jgi:hypothetical protein
MSQKEILSHVFFRKYIPRIGAKRKIFQGIFCIQLFSLLHRESARLSFFWWCVRFFPTQRLTDAVFIYRTVQCTKTLKNH